MDSIQTSQLMNTYARMPVAFERGEGAWLFDGAGKKYLDAIAGLGVCGLGHAHPEITEVISDQAGKLMHTANLAQVPWQETLAGKLAEVSGLEKVFVANSGAEAIECAMKLVRLVAHGKGIDRPEIIVMEHSFHGRTLAALSATGSRKVQAGYEPLVSGFVRVPFGDFAALQNASANRPGIAAVMLEPIQGESGIQVPPPGYLKAVRELCDQNGWLMVLDEIQTGLCRTGNWYAYQHEMIKPDIVASAKALANGIPIGVCIAAGAAARAFSPGRHGSTFGGNPLACRTACKVLEIMQRDGLAEQAAITGRQILAAFEERLGDNPHVTDIRGRGLMIGIEFNQDVNHLKLAALDRGLLMNVTRDKVVRLLPPLIIDADQAGQIVETISALVGEL
jgi:acetylornithine aminotransferase